MLTSKARSPPEEWVTGVLWLIWKAQYNFVFQLRRPNLGAIIEDALLLRSTYRRWSSRTTNRWTESNTSLEGWLTPAKGTWKFNVNGSWLSGPHEGSAIGVIWDRRWTFTANFAKKVVGSSALVTDSNKGGIVVDIFFGRKLLWILEAMIQQQLSGFHVEILIDSKSLVRFVADTSLSPWALKSIFEDCKEL